MTTESPISLTRNLTRDDENIVAEFFKTQFGGEAGGFLEGVLDIVHGSSGRSYKRQRVGEGIQDGPNFVKGDDVDEIPITLVVQIPEEKSLISHIIGKAGANITAISTTSGSKVQIEKLGTRSADVYRHVTFQGTVRTVLDAFKQLQSKASELSNGSFVDVTRFVIPSELVPHIIGRAGHQIKLVQDESQCQRIDKQVEQDLAQRTSTVGVYGRTMTIFGEMYNRNYALYLILRLLAQDRSLPEAWKGTKDSPRVILSTGRAPGQPAGGGAPMISPPGAQQHHQAPSFFAPAPAGGSGLPTGPPGGSKSIQQQLEIPGEKSLTGLLIGAKGSAIVELQNSTGCAIMVDKEIQANGRRKVTISGDAYPQVARAMEVVSSKVSDWARQNNFGSQQHY